MRRDFAEEIRKPATVKRVDRKASRFLPVYQEGSHVRNRSLQFWPIFDNTHVSAKPTAFSNFSRKIDHFTKRIVLSCIILDSWNFHERWTCVT